MNLMKNMQKIVNKIEYFILFKTIINERKYNKKKRKIRNN